jgi:flagellar motor protein MotB
MPGKHFYHFMIRFFSAKYFFIFSKHLKHSFMLKIKTPYILLAAFIAFNLYSCVPQKKVSTAKQQLSQQDSLLLNYNKNLVSLDEKRQKKQDQNEMADTVNTSIAKFIGKTSKDIDTLVDQNTILINGNVINKTDWDRLRNSLSFTRNAALKINQKILFLEDLINRNMVVKLDQDVLFESGSYKASPAVIANIGKLFEPAAKEIDYFTGKYPDFTLSLVISMKGYADGTTINEGSALYNNLKTRLKLSETEPDSRDLNKELSRARAEEVTNLFKKYAATRSDNGIYKRNVFYIYEGKGEQLPDPKINDYTINDARRRIVLLFWSIFPE